MTKILRAFALLAFSLLAILPPAHAQALSQISDLGTSHPSSARDVSRDQAYAVYKWQLEGGATMYQVNSSAGRVLTAFLYSTSNGVTPMPIGEISPWVPTARLSSSSALWPNAASTGTCPCTTTKTYEDANAAIYVTTDAQGNVINVTVINKHMSHR